MILYADAIRFGRCKNPHCRAVHIDLLDSDNEAIACATVNVDEVPAFTEAMRNVAYEIAVESEDER